MREDALETFIAAVADDLAGLDRRALVEAQEAPHDSLFFGAAGTAYACWRAGRRLGAPALGEAARRLLAEAGDSFAAEGLGLERAACEASLFFGPLGVGFARALVHGGTAIDAFVDGARGPAAPLPLLDGAAGRLAAVSAIARETGHPAAGALADELADALLAAAPWTVASPGVAHGRAGLFLALLLAHRPDRPLPGWFWAELEAARAREDATWCNGTAGIVLVDAHAYRVTGEARWLDRARTGAETVWRRAGGLPDLCCGAGGGGYVLLALDRVDPGGGWRDRALDLALRSITSETASDWPYALFRGDAGLLCLAADLVTGHEPGFPCLEG